MTELEMDLRDVAKAPVESEAPWYFRLSRALERRRVRGATRLLDEVRRRGLLDVLVEYPVSDDLRLTVPIWRPCNTWDRSDVLGYEAAFVRLFGGCIGALGPDATLVDCGADIGTVSVLLRARCQNLRRIIAFEPNLSAHRVLAMNLRGLGIEAQARPAAVSDFTGRGRLASPRSDASAHAMYLWPDDHGDVRVERVDDLLLPFGKPLALKIDVEGGELPAVEGAAQAIANASVVAIAFEAHPRVALRTGTDPVTVMRRLRELRDDLAFYVDTVPARAIDPDRPVFEQVRPDHVYNIVAFSSSI